MINPVSSHSSVHLPSAPAPKPEAAAKPSQPSQKEDSVELSAQAKAALSSKDADHDGDSH